MRLRRSSAGERRRIASRAHIRYFPNLANTFHNLAGNFHKALLSRVTLQCFYANA